MRTWAAILMGLTAASASAAEAPSAEELLGAMDKNLTFQSRSSRMTMTVEGRRTRAFEMVSTSRGQDDSAVEYVAPARDKGTRMLKLGGELWIFLPSVDKVQKISGHMLRQGMMGSDVSYEDLMTSREWQKMYTARVTGEGAAGGRPCWKLEMVARDETVSYPKRVTCVDKEEMIPLRQELYALSGMLLKTWTMSEVKPFEGGRRFPTKMTIEDHVRKESVTKIEFKEIKFGLPLEKETFSLRWLERR
jgi:outer membrane lipoprotein-sorting protein